MQELLEVPPLNWPTSKFVYLPAKKENSSRLKKRPLLRKTLQCSGPQKNKRQIWRSSCGENLCGFTVRVRERVRFTCGQDFTRTSEWQNICGNLQSYIEPLNKLFKIDRAIQKDFVMNEYSFEYSFIGSNLYSISLTWFSVFRLLLEVDVFAVPDCIVLSTCHHF